MPQSQDAMSGEIQKREVTVADPLGFHMRPVAAFAQRAGQYQSAIWVYKNEQRVNGKSILELMLLAAEQGTVLVLEAEGAVAAAALEALAELIEVPGADEAPADPSLPPKG
jgi:phosphocarrier protein HPr